MFNIGDNQNKSMHIQLMRSEDEFFHLKERWNTLLDESVVNSIFLRWEWLYSWWNAYREDNYKLTILLVFREKDLIGIAPFYVKKLSLNGLLSFKRLLFLGTREGDVISEFMDIICKPGEEETVVPKIIDFIVQEDLSDDLCLHKIDPSSNTISVLQRLSDDKKFLSVVQEEYESPYIALPDTIDDFFNNLGSSLRSKLRNNRRKLDKYHDVFFRKSCNVTDLDKDFEELVRLHQLRWKSRNFPGSFSGEKFFMFQKTVMPLLLNNGNLELWFLSVGNKNIGALYNIRHNNKIYFYQGGLDTSFDEGLAPGYLLHNHCIEDAIQQGLDEYHFLLMGNLDAYKKQWAKNCRKMCDIYIARPGMLKVLMAMKNKARNYYHSLHNHYERLCSR
ncbi:MAG: GNAT family N-acetyltransferase [Thermodesulfovibrionales bacterium]